MNNDRWRLKTGDWIKVSEQVGRIQNLGSGDIEYWIMIDELLREGFRINK